MAAVSEYARPESPLASAANARGAASASGPELTKRNASSGISIAASLVMLRRNAAQPPPLPEAARRPRVLGQPRDTFAGSVASRLLEAGERFRRGDYHRALLVAMRLLEDEPVPALCVSDAALSRARLDSQERMLIALINGKTLLEDVIESVGLGILEGIEVVTRLAAAGLVSIAPRRTRAA